MLGSGKLRTLLCVQSQFQHFPAAHSRHGALSAAYLIFHFRSKCCLPTPSPLLPFYCLLLLLLVSVFPRFTISFGIAVSDIHCFRDTGHFYPCVCVFGYSLLSAGSVTYLQDIDFARLLSCGDVERKTEVLTVSSLHLSIDEVRTGVFRGTVTLSLSLRAKTISGPSLYSQLSQLLPTSVILFSTFAEYSALQ